MCATLFQSDSSTSQHFEFLRLSGILTDYTTSNATINLRGFLSSSLAFSEVDSLGIANPTNSILDCVSAQAASSRYCP